MTSTDNDLVDRSLTTIAERLGGEVRGGEVLCPGPGHSGGDRSLSVKPDAGAPDGFLIHSFAGDDPVTCRDHVRQRLGLPAFEARKSNGKGGKPWKQIGEYFYQTVAGAPYLRVRKYLDESGKKQFPQHHLESGQWVKGKPAGPKIPYRLPELIAAPVTATTYFCEGEKDADALAKIGFVATTASEGAGAAWEPALSPWFKDRPVVILPHADRVGRAHGQKVARALHGVAASVKLVDLFPDRTDGSDVSDFLANDRAGSRLAQLVKGADEWEPPSDASAGDGKSDDELISELAALSKLAYEKRRQKAAERLGVRVSALDKIVAKARGEAEGTGDKVLYPHWNVEPSEEPVEGDALLAALVETIRRYVFLSADHAVAVALWIIFSWLHDREAFATHSPILFVTSAEKDSEVDPARCRQLPGAEIAAKRRYHRGGAVPLDREMAADANRRRGRRCSCRQRRSAQCDQFGLDARPGRDPLSPRYARARAFQHVCAKSRRHEGP
jgi:hypothetical protein